MSPQKLRLDPLQAAVLVCAGGLTLRYMRFKCKTLFMGFVVQQSLTLKLVFQKAASFFSMLVDVSTRF